VHIGKLARGADADDQEDDQEDDQDDDQDNDKVAA
jgi:hypothetical protein